MKLMQYIISVFCFVCSGCDAQEHSMSAEANNFLKLLSRQQRQQAQYPFDTSERFAWHYVPQDDRKGISVNKMDQQQFAAAKTLMKTAISDTGYAKAMQIMALEKMLKAIESRSDDDHYRDTGKYFFTIFGEPSNDKTWGWRVEGHHLSLNFTIDSNRLTGGTPSFLGANPAVVLSGPKKGWQILKKENELALDIIHALNTQQLNKAITDSLAPGEILTTASRRAVIDDTRGLRFNEMNEQQQALFMQLLSLYIHRYTHLFASAMMKEIEDAGLSELLFIWAGSTEDGPGHPRYYRIQGPTIIIEFDNTQNNGNHVHTVVRDLKNDFGGDQLLEHYKKDHH